MRTPLFVSNERLFANRPSDLSNTLANVMNILRTDASGAASLLAHEQTSPDLTVYVQPGRNIAVNGVTVDFLGGTSPTFTPPGVGTRTDLLVLNDAGTLEILTGISGSLNYPQTKRAICEVLLIAGDTEIEDDRITDARQFFGAPTITNGQATTNKFGSDADNTPTNTLFSLDSGSYTVGVGAVTVYLDGIRQQSGEDYTEESTTTIRMTDPVLDTQKVTIVVNEQNGFDLTTRVAKAGDTMTGILQVPELNINSGSLRIFRDANEMMFTDIDNPVPLSLSDLAAGVGGGASVNHEEFVASASQTLFNLAFTYTPASDTLLVFRNGLLQRKTDDYLETSTTSVTFVTPQDGGETITFHNIS